MIISPLQLRCCYFPSPDQERQHVWLDEEHALHQPTPVTSLVHCCYFPPTLISNGGVYGSMMSTPIINPPQSAILGMHAINQVCGRWCVWGGIVAKLWEGEGQGARGERCAGQGSGMKVCEALDSRRSRRDYGSCPLSRSRCCMWCMLSYLMLRPLAVCFPKSVPLSCLIVYVLYALLNLPPYSVCSPKSTPLCCLIVCVFSAPW